MKPNKLLMFSGGLDSTGVFWHYMQEKEPLYVHHMNLKNIENRHIAEKNAVNNIVQYMQNIGKFIYSESTHEYPKFNNSFIWDCEMYAFMAGTICNSMPWIKYIVIGRTATDEQDVTAIARIEKSKKIIETMCKATKLCPLQHIHKKEIYDMLPSDLKILTWSCRRPIYQNQTIIPCGKCKTCYEMKKYKIIQQKQLNHIQSLQ